MGHICMVLDGAYPNDIRVRKEAESLVGNGKKVLVICPKKKNELKEETINGVLVYRIGNNYTHFQKGIMDMFESVFNVNPFFYFNLKKVFNKYQIDFLHVHDLPLAGTCFLFKYEVKKIVLDLHENFPEALKTWFLWKKRPLIKLKNKIFMNPIHWSKKEEKYCKKYDIIICVVDEMKEKLSLKFDIELDKMVVISNHESKKFADNFNQGTIQNVVDGKCFSITYVGGFGPHRGLDTVIKAMSRIAKSIPNVMLYLVGKGSKDVELKLRELVVENNVNDYVSFVGYRPFAEVATIMKESTINIIPHNSDEHTNNTIPHKLFQIMLSKSLLVVSSCKPLKRIVEKYDAGLVFKAGDSDDFYNRVFEAFTTSKSLVYKTENAYDAVMNKNENWESESLKLINLYYELEK